jgi:hypothetical protein
MINDRLSFQRFLSITINEDVEYKRLKRNNKKNIQIVTIHRSPHF